MKTILQKIVMKILCGNVTQMKYHGYIDYPNVGRLGDVDVYRLICNHSRLIDRLSPAKMTEMALLGQCILMGLYSKIDPNDPEWTFYGKNSLYKKDDWG